MATHEERSITDGINRRSVLRGGLLIGAGVATVGVASAALTVTAKAVSPQPNWAFCSFCCALWYTANGSNGSCPSSGGGPQGPSNAGHQKTPSYNYDLVNNSDGGTQGGQGNWYWCSQCQVLFTSLHTPSYCPATPYWKGPHKAGGSFEYYLLVATKPSTDPQTGWYWCNQCQELFSEQGEGYCPDPNLTAQYGNPAHSNKGSDNYGLAWNGVFSY
jgi:hypothetical protein